LAADRALGGRRADRLLHRTDHDPCHEVGHIESPQLETRRFLRRISNGFWLSFCR
jgi:hypothetical protein